MAVELWTQADLMAVLTDDRGLQPQDYWMSRYFGATHISTKEEIMFDRVSQIRRVAPFVLPNEQGKPIYRRQGEMVESFKPAYIKVKDAVRPVEALRARPSELFRGGLLTPEQRFNAGVVDVVEFHKTAIWSQWELMAARSILYGYIDIRYRRDGEPGTGAPSVRVDFGRDPGHTVTLAPGADWSDPDFDMYGFLQAQMDKMRNAKFGGNPTKLTLGAATVTPFLNNKSIKDKLDTNFRGGEGTQIDRGLRVYNDPENPETRIGSISPLDIYAYTGFMNNDDGSAFPIMDPKSVLLTAGGIDGVKCYGAIMDKKAGLAAVDVFGKMWDEEDPSVTQIMHQSAPLMIPVNPNRTLLARVLQ